MEQRVSFVTLGVTDVAKARAFYEALGWVASPASKEGEVAFFQAGPMVVALWKRSELAKDAGVPDSTPAFSGVALAWNGRSKTEVDSVMAEAAAAGARIAKPAEKTFWGGYAGYFADPDGHLWEVAHNPFFPIDDAGAIHLPK